MVETNAAPAGQSESRPQRAELRFGFGPEPGRAPPRCFGSTPSASRTMFWLVSAAKAASSRAGAFARARGQMMSRHSAAVKRSFSTMTIIRSFFIPKPYREPPPQRHFPTITVVPIAVAMWRWNEPSHRSPFAVWLYPENGVDR